LSSEQCKIEFNLQILKAFERNRDTSSRTVARKFAIGGICVCDWGLDFLKIDKIH